MFNSKLLAFSVIVGFSLSLLTSFFLFPDYTKLLYTNIAGGNVEISGLFLVKLILILGGQTSLLGTIFYTIAKKIFIK